MASTKGCIPPFAFDESETHVRGIQERYDIVHLTRVEAFDMTVI